MKKTYKNFKKRLTRIYDKIRLYKQLCLEYLDKLKTVYLTIVRFKENLLIKYFDIKRKVEENITLNYLTIKNIYNTTYKKLFNTYNNISDKYKSLPNTDPYKKTITFIQHLFKNLATLHQKTLVTAIVKFIFLFRKYYKK